MGAAGNQNLANYYCSCLTGVVCLGWGGALVVFLGGNLLSLEVFRFLSCSKGQGSPFPQSKPPPTPTEIEFEMACLCPAAHKVPSLVLLGVSGVPAPRRATTPPQESHIRAGPGCPRKGSTARGSGLAEPPQVGPLTSIPPPHFSVDDLIELCLFVPGTTEHVLEAINYQNVVR